MQGVYKDWGEKARKAFKQGIHSLLMTTFFTQHGLDETSLTQAFGKIEEPDAKQLAEKILKKIEDYEGFIESYLQADGSSLAALMEIKDMDKDTMNELYKQLIIIKRNYQLADLADSEEALLTFIKETLPQWDNLRKQIITIVQQAKESWKHVKNVHEELGYLG